MALARITTQFPEYSIALARNLRAQGFEVHTCAPGESTSRAADLEITLKPCAQEDRQSALDPHATDKDMFVVVSPGVDASKVRSVEMVMLRPRAEIEASRKAVTPAQVIVMSMASLQGNRFHPQRRSGRWEAVRAKAAAAWELACALCWQVSKTTREAAQKVKAAFQGKPAPEPSQVLPKNDSGIDPELVPSMFGLSSEALGIGAADFAPIESTSQRSWREPLVAFCARRWGIVASAIALGLASLVVPQLWHSNASSQPMSSALPAETVPAVAPAKVVAGPTAAVAKAPLDSARRVKPAVRGEVDDDMQASFGDDVTVRHFPAAGGRGPLHPTQAISRRVVMN